MNNNELYHYGVPGMKWGRRKAGYVTVRKANLNAKRAASAARKESIANDKKNLSGIGSGRKMLINAKKAGDKAREESFAKDRAYNRELRYKKMSPSKAKVARAKDAYNDAKKQYNKDFNTAYNYSSRHMISQYMRGKNHKISDANWSTANKSANAADKAKAAYKQAKKDAKADKQKQKERGKAAVEKAKAAYKSKKDQYIRGFSDASDAAYEKAYNATYNALRKSGVRKGKAESKAYNAAIAGATLAERQYRAKYESGVKKAKSDYKTTKKRYR